MIASATYEDWCALTEGTDGGDEADLRADLRALEGGDMLEMNGLSDHDGDGGDEDTLFREELEGYLSTLPDMERAVVAGNALASCSDDHALITVCEWLCKAGPEARAVIAREATALVARSLQRGNEDAHRSIVDVFRVVSPDALGKALARLPVGVE